MARFDDAQVGDKVYCRLWGFGNIDSVSYDSIFRIHVQFDKKEDCYTLKGEQRLNSVEPILYYVDGGNKYSETRPSPQLDWSKVPVDTRVLCKNEEHYTSIRRHYKSVGVAFYEGFSSFTCINMETNWNIIALAEPVTIDGITWPIGTTWRREK